VLAGSPSYINMLDALNGWQLVLEASRALGRPAAASFKHVSPAGAAVAGPVDDVTAGLYGIDAVGVGALTRAYLRARDADPKSSYGDFAAVSHPVEADEAFAPPVDEAREVFGLRLRQQRDTVALRPELLDDLVCGELPATAAEDLLLGMAVLRYTQSNSVCYLRGGTTLGIGAGQQSRVDCTRLAGAKADTWWLHRHPAVRALAFQPGIRRQDRINWQIRFVEGDLAPDESVRLAEALVGPVPELTAGQRRQWRAGLSEVAFVSDGALPFRDNVDHACRHGVGYIAEPGGSIRSGEVEDACREHQITLVRTGLRLFHH
jgi:AICAR transformylase/IMP cyclohydrolase PurH